MRKSINLLISVWLVMLSSVSVGAQNLPPKDSSVLRLRKFSQDAIKEFRLDKDFNYQATLEPGSSLWDRFWDYVWRIIMNLFQSAGGEKTLHWSLWIVAVAVLTFFIWQLTKMRASGMFSSAKGRGMGYVISDEDIHRIDFNKEIDAAVTAGDHRLAVRLLYLQTLKKLSDSALIDWRIDKTNLSYLEELKQAAFYPLFRKLTIQFENNWYGNIPVTSQEFATVSTEFTSLHNQFPV